VPPEGSSTDSVTTDTTSVTSVIEIPFLSRQLFLLPENERNRTGRAASTAIVTQQATQASVILCPGKPAESRLP
jgi:hypothetical protein